MRRLSSHLILIAGLSLCGSAWAQPRVCDVDLDTDIDRGDVALISSALNQRAAAGDPRDPNADGSINVIDARLCVLRCSLPNCAINARPVANAGADQAAQPDLPVTLDGSASTDADGGPLPITYAWRVVRTPDGVAVPLSDATALRPTFTPRRAGDYEFELLVSDRVSTSLPDRVLVTTANVAPVANAGPDRTVSRNATVALDASGSQDANGDLLAYQWQFFAFPGASAPTLDVSDPIRPTFIASTGRYELRLTVRDPLGAQSTDTVAIDTEPAPNTKPTANAGGNQSVPLGATVTVSGLGSSDPEGTPLSYRWSMLSQPAGSSVVLPNPGPGTITFVAARAGTYQVQLVVGDGEFDSDPAVVSISTTNTPPIAVALAPTDVTQGAVVALDGRGSSDADGDGLTYQWAIVGQPGAPPAPVIANAVFPQASFVAERVGTYSVQLTVTDDDNVSASDTVSIRVAPPANRPPVAGSDVATTAEDTPVVIDVLANDTDPDAGDTLTVTGVSALANGSASTDGTRVTFTPAANFNGGPIVFTYTVADGRGASATGTISVTVTPVNDPPVGSDDAASTANGTAVTIDVLANDTDLDGDTLVAGGVTLPANGTLSNVGSSITYTPRAGFSGTDRFTYRPFDGVAQGNVVTVTVTVQAAANTAPVGVNDSATTPFGAPVVIAVLANDTDAENDTLVAGGVTPPANGTLSNVGATITYTPNAGFSGTDGFTYRPFDGQLQGNVTAVTVVVEAPVVTPPPSASAVIGPAGGTLVGPDGAQLIVPPGALTEDVELRITRTGAGAPELPPGVSPDVPIYEVTPHGLTFLQPVELRLPLASDAQQDAVVLFSSPTEPWTFAADARFEGRTAILQRSSLSWFSPLWAYSIYCSIQPGDTDPYPCVLTGVSPGTVTTTPPGALQTVSPTETIITRAAVLNFDISYGAARDCADARVVVTRVGPTRRELSLVTLLDRQVPMTPTPGSDTRSGGTLRLQTPVDASLNGYLYYLIEFGCTRGFDDSRAFASVTGTYRVEITQDAAPVITQQPVDQTFVAGGSAAFGATAVGTPTPSYEWIFDGSPLAEGQAQPLPGAGPCTGTYTYRASDGTLSLANLSAGCDGLTVSVVAANSVGDARSSPARLVLLGAGPAGACFDDPTGWCYVQPVPHAAELTALAVSSTGELVAAGAVGTLQRSTDDGGTWGVRWAKAQNGERFDWQSIAVLSTGRLVGVSCCSGASSGIYVSDDGGTTWALKRNAGQFDVAFQDDRVGVAVSTDIWRTEDGGDSWTFVADPPLGTSLYRVAYAGNGVFVAVGEPGAVWRSIDGGRTWQAVTLNVALGFANRIRDVAFDPSGSGIGLAVVNGPVKLLRTTDFGATWQAVTNLPPSVQDAPDVVAFASARRVVLLDADGRAVRSEDAGATWPQSNVNEDLVTGDLFAWNRLRFIDADRGVGVGAYGVVARTVDGGRTWEQTAGGIAGFSDLAVAPGGATVLGVRVFSSGSSSVQRSVNGGRTWSDPASGQLTADYLAWADGSTALAAGLDGVYLTIDAGRNWQPVLPDTDPITGVPVVWGPVAMATPDVAIAAASRLDGSPFGQGGLLRRTVDGGATWSEVALPGVPGFTLLSAVFVSPTVGYVGGSGLWRTADAGVTWTRLTVPTVAGSTVVRHVSVTPGGVLLVSTDDGVLRSTDGGASFTTVLNRFQLPGIDDIAFADADVGLAVGEAGIYRTSDAGRTWTRLDLPVQDSRRSVVWVSPSSALVGGASSLLRNN